jgi:uncharacterized protein (DUF2342 family)
MNAQNTQPNRGIIVVDSTCLSNLGVAYGDCTPNSPIDNLKQKTGTYLDVLLCLAERGFQIVVPEAVALESAGRTLRYDLKQYFDDRKPTYATESAVRTFLNIWWILRSSAAF